MFKNKKQAENIEVLVGGNGKDKRGSLDPWDKDFGPIIDDNIRKILKVPDNVETMEVVAEILAGANFANGDDRKDYLSTIQQLLEFKLWGELEFILTCAHSTLGEKAFGKTAQLQFGVGIAMPNVIREQISLGRGKGEKDQKVKRSDFQEQEYYEGAKRE